MPEKADDPACLAALARVIGHPPPFSAQELGGIRTLSILHARDLVPIASCLGLEYLRIAASELSDLWALDAMAKLRHLELHCVDVASILPVINCERLERIDLLFTTMGDSTELLGGDGEWRGGALIGNNWSELSWDWAANESARGLIRLGYLTRYDQELTWRLQEKAQACCGGSLVVRPGLPKLTANAYDALLLHPALLQAELDKPDFSLEALFRTYAPRITAPDLAKLFPPPPATGAVAPKRLVAARPAARTEAQGDGACLAALAGAIGHAPPFSDAELAALTSLRVTQARDLSPLARCANLETLRLEACELAELEPLCELQRVWRLDIHCTAIGSLAGATSCPELERVDLLYTSLREAADLLDIRGLRQATLIGNPWDEVSFSALASEAGRGRVLVDLPPRQEWLQARRLFEAAKACCGRSLVVRPGLPLLTRNAYDAIEMPSYAVAAALDQSDFSLVRLFEEGGAATPDLDALVASRELGRQDDARAWIASSLLPPDDKAALERFVQSFPGLIHHRASAAAVDRVAAAYRRDGIELPAWYRTLLMTLGGWMPHLRAAPMRLNGFDGWAPCADRVQDIPYELGPRPYPLSETKEMLVAAGIVIVGLSTDGMFSHLAIRARDDDRKVYEFSDEDMMDAYSEKRAAMSSIYPVFPSYAQMLAAVMSIKPEGGEEIWR